MNRRALFPVGLLLLGALWFGPLPELARASFSAHMALHMGIVAVVAPVIALGIAGGRFDPVARFPAWFPPVPLSLLELAAVWGWHAPALHEYARESSAGFAAEQATFLAAGFLVWVSVFGGGRLLRQERRGAGLAALLLTSMHMTLLGALLALTPRPLYARLELCALPPLDDQHLGGAIMLLVGGVVYLAGGAWLTVELLRGQRHAEALT